MDTKNKITYLSVSVLVLLVLIGSFLYFLSTTSSPQKELPAMIDTVSWKSYKSKNPSSEITFKYPQEWKVEEFTHSDGSFVIGIDPKKSEIQFNQEHGIDKSGALIRIVVDTHNVEPIVYGFDQWQNRKGVKIGKDGSLPAKYSEGNSKDVMRYDLENQIKSVSISYEPQGSSLPSYKSAFDEILASFSYKSLNTANSLYTSWKLASLNDQPASGSITFGADGKVNGQFCNRVFGAFSVVGDTIQSSGRLASTRMACPDNMVAEDTFLKMMEQKPGPQFSLNSNSLVIYNADNTFVFKSSDAQNVLQTVKGRLIKLDSDKTTLADKYRVASYLTQYLVESATESGSLQYYMVTGIEDDASKAAYYSPSGSCVELNVLGYDTKPVDLDEYYKPITPLLVRSLKISDSLDCFPNALSFTVVPSAGRSEITGVVLPFARPAYDIAYDYYMRVPYSEIENKGFYDASGLEKSPDVLMNVFLVPENAAMLKELELRKKAGQPVKLKGGFTVGYAESSPFVVQAVE